LTNPEQPDDALHGSSSVPRTDYLNDPGAPAPNSIVPAASAVVTNPEGEILLQRRSDNHLWTPPGGTMDLGERIAETVVREVREESGLTVEVTGSSASTATPATSWPTRTARSARSSTSVSQPGSSAAGCQ
jgi:8-oxo-dGTP pyrophosphatase MutT (NUDIX family)